MARCFGMTLGVAVFDVLWFGMTLGVVEDGRGQVLFNDKSHCHSCYPAVPAYHGSG